MPDKSIAVRPSGGISTNNDTKTLTAIKAQLAKNYDAIIGARKHEGDYSLDFFPDYPSYFILSALGLDTPALATSESVVYNHVITEQAGKPSFTLEQMVGENVRRYAGAICSGFKITAKQGDVITIDPKFSAKSQTNATKITAAYPTYVRPFNFADATIKVGGSAITGKFLSFELEYKNNLEMIYALGSNDPSAYSVKPSEVSGKMELTLDNTTLTELNNYLSKTYRSLEFIATQTDTTIGNASNYAIDIVLPKCVYKTSDTKVTDSYNVLTIDWDGIFDISTSTLIKAIITNLLATYA